MKKLFFLATVALGMTAACQKPDVKVEEPEIDDNAPVEVKFGVNAPTLTVTKTKAAVDDWNSQTVYVYGFTNTVTDLNTDKILIDGKPATVGADVQDTNDGYPDNSSLTFTTGDDQIDKYYYEVEGIYNFYAYYTGKTEKDENGNEVAIPETVTKNGTTLTATVTIDGSQDVMLATTTPANDIAKAREKYPDVVINENKVYSAYAARRGVNPTLDFQHMLSRFTFKVVKGYTPSDDENTATVNVTGIKIETYNEGTLDITNQKFDAIKDNDKVWLSSEITNGEYTPTETAAVAGTDLMVFPGETSMNLKVSLAPQDMTTDPNLGNIDTDLMTMNVPLDAAKIKGSTGATFLAGERYTVTITVYSLEEVQVSANLTEWVDAGDYTYDPDDDWDNEITPTPTIKETKATYTGTDGQTAGTDVTLYSNKDIADNVNVYTNKALTKKAENGHYSTDTHTFQVQDGVVTSYTEKTTNA